MSKFGGWRADHVYECEYVDRFVAVGRGRTAKGTIWPSFAAHDWGAVLWHGATRLHAHFHMVKVCMQ